MRVSAGLSEALAVSELDQHLTFLSSFAARLDQSDASSASISMVLRSAESVAAQAFLQMVETLRRSRVTARLVVAKLEPEEPLQELCAALSAMAPEADPKDLIRWAKNPKLHDAHEQVTFGEAFCWSGDAMRREPGKRNTLSIRHEGSDAAQLAERSFAALWCASQPVPVRYLTKSADEKSSGAYQEASEALFAISVARPLQGWPLVRH
jgi:hypothetical protein